MSNNVSKNLKLKAEFIRNLETATKMMEQGKISSHVRVYITEIKLAAFTRGEEQDPVLDRIMAGLV